MILISSLLFLAGQFSATLAANELNASNHLKKLEEVFLRFDRQNREFLLNENTVKAVEAIIEGEDAGAADEFKNYFRRFDENCDVRNQVIITNTEGEVLFTSFASLIASAKSSLFNGFKMIFLSPHSVWQFSHIQNSSIRII